MKVRGLVRGSLHLLGAATALGFAFADTPSRSQSEYWEETRLTLIDVRDVVVQKDCYAESKTFLGCVRALNAIAHSFKPPLAVVTEEELLSPNSRFGETLTKLGPLSLVVARVTTQAEGVATGNAYERWSAEFEMQQAQASAVERLRADSSLQVDFEDWFAELQLRAPLDGAGESLTAARALNAYLASEYDPHTQIIPVQELADELNRTGAVEAEWVRDSEKPIARLKVSHFLSLSVCEDLRTAILEKQAQGAVGWILDLRGNPGGRVDIATCAAGLFVGQRLIFTQQNLETHAQEPSVSSTDALTDLPMITLINAKSASVSEVVAGALRDYGRSWIAGETSFGKGTAQEAVPFSHGKKIMMLKTVTRFYLPADHRSHQITGIEPDFPIAPDLRTSFEVRFTPRERHLLGALPESPGSPEDLSPSDQVALLRTCADSMSALETYIARPETTDFQLLVARDLLICEVQRLASGQESGKDSEESSEQ